MRGLDLRNFKKIKSDAKSTTMEHPDGHEIKVNHAVLDPKTRQALHALPFCEGGEVQKFADGGSVQFDMPAQQQQPAMFGFGAVPDAPEASAAAPQNMQLSSPTPVANDRTPAMAAPQASTSGLDMQMRGIQNEANVQGKVADQQAGIQQGQSDQLANIAQQAQSNAQQHDQEVSKVVADMQNDHIDPDHYMNSKSTAGKVSTAIGLILGGMGGGVLHQDNAAQRFLMQNINNDIEAQKANMTQKHNLLTALNQQYGDKQSALLMLKAIYTEKTATDLQQAALKSGNPLAQARAQQAIGPLLQQKQQIMAEMGLRQAALQHVATGGDPAQVVPLLVPKEHQKDVFTEIQKAQDAKKNSGEILSAFDQANEENTALKTMGGLRTPGSIMKMRALALPMIHDAEGRVNEFEAKTLNDLEPKPGDMPGKIAEKRAALQAFLTQKSSAPTAKGYGIDLSRNATTAPQANVTMGAGPRRK